MRKFIYAATTALMIGLSAAPAVAGNGYFRHSFGPGVGAIAVTGAIFGGLILGGVLDSPGYSYASPAYYYPGPVYYQTNYVPNYVAPPAPPPESLAYYSNSFDTYCREFTKNTRTDDNQILERHGTVCLQPDGMWRVIRYE